MAVEIFTNNPIFKDQNVEVRTLIGDEDSSTIASVRRAASFNVIKWSVYNHIKKGFTSHLYTLKLSPQLISYFGTSFAIAIKKNRGNAKNIALALQAIVPHAYNNHSQCGDWCEGITNKNYVSKYLPQGKFLTDLDLKIHLTSLINKYVCNTEKISQCGSTQINESMNEIVASKCPKTRHYSSSDSFNFRVSAAICQKNLGVEYSSNVFKKMGYVECERSINSRKHKDALRQIKHNRQSKKETKQRRQMLKKVRSNKNVACDRREGITYESNFPLDDVSSLIPFNNVQTIENIDFRLCKVIIYDLETTGRSLNDEIVQIAIESLTETTKFNAYIIPTKQFSKEALNVTGLHLQGGELYLYENRVKTIPAMTACQKFLEFLQNFNCPLILVAHNGFSFDNSRLIRLMTQYKLYEQFSNLVKGFADSLKIFGTILTERKAEKKSFL